MDIPFLLLAFTVGLFSTVHCLGMCGGIVGALSLSLKAEVRENRWSLLSYLLAYNVGRLASYVLAGGIIAALGTSLSTFISPQYGHDILQWIAALTMIGIGLYVAGWFPRFAALQRIGTPVWRTLEPIGRRLLPVASWWQALVFGLIWGWLPCGLVYAAAIYASSAGSTINGAMFMLAFGLGTLPTALVAGFFAGQVMQLTRQPNVRRSAGLAIVFLAIVTLVFEPSMDHSRHFQPLIDDLHQH